MPETRQRKADSVRASAEPLRFEASLSSEEPVMRGWGYEVLEHTPEAVDLTRASVGLPLLFAHDPERPVGMLENVRIASRRLRATLRLFSTEAGKEAATMIKEGLRALSIGYEIHTTAKAGTRNGAPVVTATRWTPLECSLVAVPADATVGIGRSKTLHLSKDNTTMDTQELEHKETTAEAEARWAASIAKDENRERARTREIVAIGERFRNRPQIAPIIERALKDGWSVADVRTAVLKSMENRGVTMSDIGASNWSGSGRQGVGGYSLRELILAQVEPAKYGNLGGFERERSQEIERQYGTRAQGTFIPPEVLRRDLATTLNGGASVIQSTVEPALMADVLRPAAMVIQAGARVLTGLSGNLRIPRQTSGATASWKAEQGAADETDVTLDNLELSPKRLTAYVDVSRQQLIQGSVDVENMLRSDLQRAADQLIDDAAINGTGTGNAPRGIRQTPGVGSVVGGANGAQLSWGHVVDLEAAVANANVPTGAAGYLANPKTRAWLRKTPRGTNLDFVLPGKVRDEPLNGWPLWVSSNVPSNLTKGTAAGVCSSLIYSADWSELIVARFGELDLIVDPYSFATTATIRITINQFLDIGVRRPVAFAVMDDALTA